MAFKRFIACGDIHGNEQDLKANEVMFKFKELWKPQIAICTGDLWNFAPLRKGASQDEREQSLHDDAAAGQTWLDRFRPNYFIRGNHDERLWVLAKEGRGIERDFAREAIAAIEKDCKKTKTIMLPYDRREGVLKIGSLKLIHGFATGVNAARKQALTYGSVLCWHGHGIQHVSIEGLDNRMGRMCGCLCNLNMDYVKKDLGSLIWRHGFAYGVIDEKTGFYAVWQAEEVEGTWMLPSDIVEIK